MDNIEKKREKVDLTLISATANECEARVLEIGDSKYSRRDYLNHEDYDREAMKALLRHVNEILKGNQYDQESGQHHLAHVRANTGIILEFWASHKTEPGSDWPHIPAKPVLGDPPDWPGETLDALHAKADAKGEERFKGKPGTIRRATLQKGPDGQWMVPQGRDCTS